MNPGLTLSLHWWRGFSLSPEPTLFWVEFRLGFVTVSLERTWPLAAYRKLRVTMQEAVVRMERGDEEGR